MEMLKNPFFLLAIYGTACYVLTLITRKIVEAAKPTLRKQAEANDKKITYLSDGSRWWNEAILYTLAPIYGVVLALAMQDTEFFPQQFKGSTIVVIMAGLCVGFTCSWFFKIFKKLLSKATGVLGEDLDAPTSDPDIPGDK